VAVLLGGCLVSGSCHDFTLNHNAQDGRQQKADSHGLRGCEKIVWASQETYPTSAEVLDPLCRVRLPSCPRDHPMRFFHSPLRRGVLHGDGWGPGVLAGGGPEGIHVGEGEVVLH
jgi:hypothetical protein